jgi:DNA repair exonuclease SbcCD ATPase subunit
VDVRKADRAGEGKVSRLPTSPSQTQDALTRLWKGADSSYGHQFEAVAELRERKRREQESPRRRARKRGSNIPDRGVPAARTPDVPVAGKQSKRRGEPSGPDVVSSEPMTPLRPEDLNISALPRSPLGHLKTEAVEELLRRAAWDYREALAQNQQLSTKVEHLTQRVDELTAEIGSLEQAATKRKNPDELARALLAAAQRTARAERDLSRQEAESTLKKARMRAERIEKDVARRTEQHLEELARLQELREDVIKQLRALLQDVADRYGERVSEDGDAIALIEAPQ